jgi:uncharacterized membrane protein YoaK (UPF0700 family)
VFDKIAIVIELLADLLVRSSEIMQYPVWLRRAVLLTAPVSLPFLAILSTIGSFIVYLTALTMSIVAEVREEGFAYLFHAPAVSDLLRR